MYNRRSEYVKYLQCIHKMFVWNFKMVMQTVKHGTEKSATKLCCFRYKIFHFWLYFPVLFLEMLHSSFQFDIIHVETHKRKKKTSPLGSTCVK